MTKPSEQEIEKALQCARENEGLITTAYPERTYEQGVEYTLNWLLHGGENPFND